MEAVDDILGGGRGTLSNALNAADEQFGDALDQLVEQPYIRPTDFTFPTFPDDATSAKVAKVNSLLLKYSIFIVHFHPREVKIVLICCCSSLCGG